MEQKKILVTGATGFIGGHVVNELLHRGHKVIASSGDELKASLQPWFGKVDYKPLDLELADTGQDLYHYFNRPDAVIHLAWPGLPDYRNPNHVERYFPAQAKFLRNLVTNGAREILVTGTCFEYGMQEGMLSETMPAAPSNPYGMAKDMLRMYLDLLRYQYPFNLRWMRLFYMYGAGQAKNAILSQLAQAIERGDTVFNMSGGLQKRDYLPVETIASYLVSVCLSPEVNGIINCCSGQPITISDLVERYCREQGSTIALNKGFYPYNDYEPMNFWGDNRKLLSILNND